MIVYEYLDRAGGVLTGWALEKRQRTRLDAKVEMLERASLENAKHLLHGIRGFRGLFKLKIRVQSVQLRPILCYGPQRPGKELTFLVQACERQSAWEPGNAREQGVQRQGQVARDSAKRRLYETDSS